MCGIVGFNWKDGELVEKMNSCIVHRGPDAGGIFEDDGITLGNRRLAVIDLGPEANQPMLAGDLVIVYNGEIYNYKELKNELKNYNFETESDTEVILAGYKIWGKDVVRKLNGIFAFAIWDKNKKELFCARDHMGVKPFYYTSQGEKFIFASEIKAILEHDLPRELDLQAFNEYIRVLYVPEPRTMIKDILKLPPGHTLMLKNGELYIEGYYKPELYDKKWNYGEAKDKVQEIVEKAVERQLVADVPVGIYLSGGIDSSVVLAAASKLKKNIKTFSIGFDLEEGEESEKFNRDFELARETAKHFGAEHHELVISSRDVADTMEVIIGSMDDPVSNPTAIPMAHLAKFAKSHVTVVLSGNGGDELFGGYERYRMSRRVDVIGKITWVKYFLPKRIRQAIEMSALNRLAQFEFEKDWRLTKVVNEKYFIPAEVVKKDFEKYISKGDRTAALMQADLTSWLPDQALSLGDKMSMLGSLEERVPFLDRKVVDLAMSLPLSFKATSTQTKRILKDAFRGILPEALFGEPKRGWFSPGAKWIRRSEILEVFKRILNEKYNPETNSLFNWKEVGEMLDKHVSKEEYNLTILWALLTFQIWAKKYKISNS